MGIENNKIKSYKDLIVWQKSMELVLAVYELTERYPKSELYILIAHTRKTSISIPSNIAEGKARGTRKNYRQFLIQAYSSGAELETQIEIAKRLYLKYKLDFRKVNDLLEEVMKILNTLISKLGD
jgi:four helix bundle protein